MSDPVEFLWKYMPDEALEKIMDLEGHHLDFSLILVISITETNLPVFHGNKSAVTQGYSMSISTDVSDNVLCLFKRGFAIDNPIFNCEGTKKGSRLEKNTLRYLKIILFYCSFKAMHKFTAENL